MDVPSIEHINPPISSFSRAGRMAESLGGKRHVKTEGKAPPPPKDYLKLLTSGDMGTSSHVAQSNNEEAYDKGDELCSSARDHPVTVKRQNFVSVIEKEIAFKSALQQFQVTGTDSSTGEVPVPKLISPEALSPIPSNKKGHQQQTNASHNTGASPLKKSSSGIPTGPNPTVSSKSPKKKRPGWGIPKKDGDGKFSKETYKVSDSTPPVGHYHPKFGILDTHQQTAFISKLRTNSPHRGRRSATPGGGQNTSDAGENKNRNNNTTAGSGTGGLDNTLSMTLGNASLSMSPKAAAASGSKPGTAESPAVQMGNAAALTLSQHSDENANSRKGPKLGTSAFLSAVPKGGPTFRSSSVPLSLELDRTVNEAHFTAPNNRSNVRFDRQVGRDEREKVMSKGQAGTSDLAYYPKLKPFHSPALPFSGQVPRDQVEKLPRTSHNVDTSQRMLPAEYSLEKTKYSKQPCPANFRKQVGREKAINQMVVTEMKLKNVGTSEMSGPAELPITSFVRHTPTFKMGKVPGRKPEKPKLAHDVVYEPDWDALDKKWPNTHITATPDRPKAGLPGCETLQIPVGNYRVDSELIHKRVLKNVDIGHVVSRDRREKLATGHLDQLSNAVYNADASIKTTQEKRVPGNPFMGTHMSRDKRMKLVSPTVELLDKSYDYSVDNKYPSLHKGAIDIGKQVQRDKHAGSMFANAMKRELSPTLHD